MDAIGVSTPRYEAEIGGWCAPRGQSGDAPARVIDKRTYVL